MRCSLRLEEILGEMVFASHKRLNSATLQASLAASTYLSLNPYLDRILKVFNPWRLTSYRLEHILIVFVIILIRIRGAHESKSHVSVLVSLLRLFTKEGIPSRSCYTLWSVSFILIAKINLTDSIKSVINLPFSTRVP